MGNRQGIISALIVIYLSLGLLGSAQKCWQFSVGTTFRVFDYVAPFVDFLQLDTSGPYFSPDPGPTYVLRYTVHKGASEEPVVGWFADKRAHWPRLYYHRRFMLVDSLYQSFVYGAESFERNWQAFEVTLARSHGGSGPAELELLERRQPLRREFLSGGSLDDPKFLRNVMEQ